MKTTYFERTCPKCGSHLIVREGEYGEFLACPHFPSCKYAEPIYKDTDLTIYQPPSPYCEKCNHTGLLPFKNKEGKVVPHSFLFCECNSQEDQIDYIALHPNEDAFDFPCSYDWRAYYRKTAYGESLPQLPPIVPQEEQPQNVEVQHVYYHVDNSRRITTKLNSLSNAIKYLLGKEEQKGGKGYKYS